MEQVLLKKGMIYTREVEAPQVEKNMVLVKTAYSCISAGTELSGIKGSSASVVRRIINSPRLVEKGLKMLKQKGFRSTLDIVQGNNDVGTAMGYTVSGVVVESGTQEFQPGDRVACMGVGYANHAEYIAAPKNLTVKVPDSVSMECAATAAVGCIAMQSIRIADVKLGEYVVIIGMGIMGQLACRMATASGATVIATDIDPRRLQIAEAHGAQHVLNGNEDVVDRVMQLTGFHGADSVIITAASESNEIISQAFQMSRQKGRVVLLGVVGMNLKREDMYKKELSFHISTSYGPGRYDSFYEEQGIDYPYGYVRFTEKRNLESYLRLLAEHKLDITDIIERKYPAREADKAYAELKTGENRPLVVLLQYGRERARHSGAKYTPVERAYQKPKRYVLNVAMCGAGSFAKGMHLPNLEKMKDKFRLYAVQSRTGANALGIATRYQADYSTTDYQRILADSNVDMVMICTRHNLHAEMAVAAMRAGKAAFVEKPMAMTEEEIRQVIDAARETGAPLLVGYNRRFSRFAVEAKKHIANRVNPIIVNYRMNAGYIPPNAWVQTGEGGGRIIGEGCHLLDLFTYFTDSKLRHIFVNRISSNTDAVLASDNCIISLKYEDGSVCTLTYTGQGSKVYGKEYCEIFCDGKTIVIDDYKKLLGYGANVQELTTENPEKGQWEELAAYHESILNGDGYPIPLWQLEQTAHSAILAQTAE